MSETNLGYHTVEIPKGEFGKATKIFEEFHEFKDALQQNNPIMALQELSDLIGAIEGYTLNTYNISLEDLLTMKQVTEKVFITGYRK